MNHLYDNAKEYRLDQWLNTEVKTVYSLCKNCVWYVGDCMKNTKPDGDRCFNYRSYDI